jgi:hypothetical protein
VLVLLHRIHFHFFYVALFLSLQPKEMLPVDDLGFMSLQVPSALGASETVMLAGPGATHGKFSAFQAAPRIVTDVTQTAKEISMRPGRRVFADE